MNPPLLKYRIEEKKFEKLSKYYPQYESRVPNEGWTYIKEFSERFLNHVPIFFYTFEEAQVAIEKHRAEYEPPKYVTYYEL